MARYRTQGRIIADILNIAKDMSADGEGVGITTLLRRGNISYGRMAKLIVELMGAGLLVEESKESPRYRLSEKGVKFLEGYSRFQGFVQSYGLRL